MSPVLGPDPSVPFTAHIIHPLYLLMCLKKKKKKHEVIGCIKYLSFCDRLISRNVVFSRFTRVAVLQHVSELHSFVLRLSNIPLYAFATFCVPVHQLMAIWAGPTF